MKRFIRMGTRELVYELERKNIKNINLRIRESGIVYVSAPLYVSEKVIEEFVLLHADWIFLHLDRIINVDLEELFSLKDGGNITILGEKYILNIESGDNNICGIDGNKLTVSLPDPNNTDSVKKLIYALCEHILKETLDPICIDVYEKYFENIGIPYPEIRIRKMKARWGSCHTQNNVIVFNKALIFVPKKCVEYVVCHEFTHFIHADHSPNFYNALGMIFPCWKECKKQLRQYSHAAKYNFL